MSSINQIARREVQDGEDPRFVQANKLYQTGVLLIHGRKKFVDKAIKCIQKAITLVDNDYKYWQILGEAYYLRGSLNPAINCFMKSIKLAEEATSETTSTRRQDDCIYSKLRVSDIRLSVGHLDEAVSGYSSILEIDPKNVAALVGLSKTELQIARNNFLSGLVKSGHGHCMEALKFSLRAIKLSPHLCITWKTASDCCLLQFTQGQRGSFQNEIYENFPGGSEEGSIFLNRRSCIELAQQFLCKALCIEPFDESGCLWHNFGLSLFLKSTIVQKEREKEVLLKRAMKSLIKALSCDRSSSQIKNSIGVVAYHLNLLNTSQNFLIRSIQSNRSTSEVQFSNLGYLYLQKGEFRLAEVSFNRCQAEDPLYSRSWLGNALLCEQKNIDNLSYLRHSHKLENNYESQLMFATKVTTLPSEDEFKYDFINALSCMRRIINYNDDSLEANNTLGLLLERCKHFEQAEERFRRAYELSPNDSRVIYNILRQTKTNTLSTSCQVNFDCSNKIPGCDFIKDAEKLVKAGNTSNILNYVYYLFRNGDHVNAISKINSYMEKLPSNQIKKKISAQILLGLSAKMMEQDFKSWLFKNVIDSENFNCLEALINLTCLMLLGAISGEEQLVEQISSDLSDRMLDFISRKNQRVFSVLIRSEYDGFWIRLALVSSIFCLKDHSKMIRPLLALFPEVAELWLYYGLAQMFQRPDERVPAVFSIEKAYLVDSTLADLSMVCDLLLSISREEYRIENRKSKSSLNSRRRHIVKALHKYPNYHTLWDTLEPTVKASSPRENVEFCLFNLAIDHLINVMLA